jgi:hypothetical protein
VPKLSRFFGIVIRMFLEAGGQHHRPHFHAYYQDQAAVFAVDTIECWVAVFRRRNSGLLKLGPRSTEQNYRRTGNSCNRANRPSRSSHSGKRMSHPIHRVTPFSIVGPYTLAVTFNDGTEQHINFRPVLQGPLFGPLQDLSTFNQVRLDTEVGTLV